MSEIIKKNWDVIFVLGIGLVLAIAGIIGMSGLIVLPSSVSAATTATVGVTATVQPWLTFSVSPTSITLSPDLVDVNGITHIASSTSNVSLILGTNSGVGWSISIIGANGGLATSSYDLIDSVATGTTTTLSNTGVDGYGANATGSIANANPGTYYANWGTATVGAIASSTPQTLINKNSSNASSTVGLMKVYAQCDSTQPSGTYGDTITLTATPAYP